MELINNIRSCWDGADGVNWEKETYEIPSIIIKMKELND